MANLLDDEAGTDLTASRYPRDAATDGPGGDAPLRSLA
jgi:hypothetical protein